MEKNNYEYIKKNSNIYFGSMSGSISYVYEYFPDFFNNYLILITCLDSNPNLNECYKWIEYLELKDYKYIKIGNSILIQNENIRNIFNENKTFYGFDELYLLKNEPSNNAEINGTFTTDGYNFKLSLPEKFLNIFNNLGAIRYLSDGIGLGLNFVCESKEICDKITNLW